MKLDTELYRLPLCFDSGRLAEEVASMDETAWQSVAPDELGDVSLPLVAGRAHPAGPLAVTPHLERCLYLRQVLASLTCVLGWTRLLRLPGPQDEGHAGDIGYYLSQRLAIHVPIHTVPEARWICADREHHLAAGEAWVVDTWRPHWLHVPDGQQCVHLVLATVGSDRLWDLMAEGERPCAPPPHEIMTPRRLLFQPEAMPELEVEQVNYPVVMSPWEQASLITLLVEELTPSPQAAASAMKLEALLERFHRRWRSLWARFGTDAAGHPAYTQALAQLRGQLTSFAGLLELSNGADAIAFLENCILAPALIEPREAAPAVVSVPPLACREHQPVDDAVRGVRVTTARDSQPSIAAGASSVAKQSTVPAVAVVAPRSAFTSSFPELLNSLGISLLVSTYQAGKLIVVRADGASLNTHFRSFPMPMGIAVDGPRLALGTGVQVWQFINQPEMARKLEPAGKHDACFVPRGSHVTGDIRIHEIAWAEHELWMVNTRFSCLCTLDPQCSFVPRWRPPFISMLAPEDRCHLNGMTLVEGRPRYVTALGQTDTPGGWRPNRAHGGCLLEVPSGTVVLDRLSMPHSPRWHNDRLWVLESGVGGLAWLNTATGRLETVALLPGFTRGLDFAGPYAFVGLSLVRESSVFGGLPLTDRCRERKCGVWVVDVRDGRTVAFLDFEQGVQEIFAVQVLPGLRYPDVLLPDDPAVAHSFVLPDETLVEVTFPHA
ncbi:MAG TPA: TIGR03032 family protein [Gemmataceae bacterium]|nr:TIGR03032 family protein [Gemmataceae bacterium]